MLSVTVPDRRCHLVRRQSRTAIFLKGTKKPGISVRPDVQTLSISCVIYISVLIVVGGEKVSPIEVGNAAQDV